MSIGFPVERETLDDDDFENLNVVQLDLHFSIDRACFNQGIFDLAPIVLETFGSDA